MPTWRPSSRPARVLLAGALVLTLLLGLTGAVEAWRVRAVDAADGARQHAATVAAVRGALASELDEMERVASSVGTDARVRAALGADSAASEGEALGVLEALRLPDHTAVEVVAPSGAQVAWSGFSFPRLPGVVPDTLLTRTSRDDAGRRALVLWWPVRAGGRWLGSVRVVRLAQAAVPVRNQYLQDYDIADEWRRSIEAPFSVQFSAATRVPEASALRGPDGSRLGHVVQGAPAPRALAVSIQETTRSVAAFWAVLLMGWLLAGLGGAYLRALRAADRRNTRRAWVRAALLLAAVAVAMVAIRYALLALDVPVRWLDAAHGTVALFNPSFLASDVGWGVMRSVGDLALTASFLLLGAGAALALALRYAAAAAQGGTRGPVRWAVGVLGAAVVPAGAVLLAALVARRAVLDATLGYTDQSGPVLDGVTAAVLASLVLLLTATLFLIAAAVVVAWAGDDRRRLAGTLLPVALAVAVAGGVAAATGRAPVAPVVAMAALGSALGGVLLGRPERWVWPLTFRGTLAGALVLAPVLYGLMAPSLAERSDARLADAARAFADTRDNRVAFAIDQVLAEARADDALRPALLDAIARADSARRADAPAAPDSTQRTLDELVSGLLGTSLLGSLADVSAELRLVSPSGATLGSSVEGSRPVALAATDSLDFGAMRREFEAGGGEGFIRRTQPLAGAQPGSRSAAIGPLLGDDGRPAAWVYLRTAPRAARSATETPFPRVLAPTGLFGLDDEALSYAEYRDGALVRSRGVAPLRLDGEVRAALAAGGSGIYRAERLGGRALRAYYEASGDAREVVAVRAPATDGLDVLFVLLRMTLAGLAGGALLYAVGIPIRRRLGLFPPPRTRFRDKVLNRFLVVGLASVTLTGLIGQSVIREQNQQVVRELLRQRLQRAEAVLGTEDLAPSAATERSASARLDAVAAALGVDVHLYRGADLEASSRRQLVRQRLIDSRLPGSVYRALFVDGEPYAFSTDRIGTFTYTTGYKALPATDARPQGVVAVPTLSEQAAIEVGQARMVAYLFGGLLGLLIVIVAFAVLLAGQLTRPFSRLRQGLEAVGAGADEEPIPVDTHDEVGELVESFNAMQAQLAESRRQLAAQERELAWSEMARQVAHEIKNPLMPMKLSVQHLQRTFRPPGEEAPPEQVRFAGQFGRTTEMLIDQIETLNRIASDFSAFARMPMRAPETVDLNEVVREAAALFESPLAESGRAALEVDLAEGALRVLADHDELRRVFVNLLANALQAIPERPAPGRIVLRTRREPDGAAVGEVQDDGEGIPAEIRPKVFQPSFSTKTSGMGLGLAISRRAVEAAGGTIAFETEIGAGTTFVVRLPAPAEAPPPNPEQPGA